MKREILEDLIQFASYDPETGLIFWRERPAHLFKNTSRWKAWNSTFAGKEALSAVNSAGYKHGTAFGVSILAHRAAWAIHTGKWPFGEIDHINGVRSDNRIGNLRDVSRSRNGQNIRRASNNTSGRVGVSYNKRQNKWVAYIKANGRHMCLGTFAAFGDAAEARTKAEMLLGFHENHGRA